MNNKKAIDYLSIAKIKECLSNVRAITLTLLLSKLIKN